MGSLSGAIHWALDRVVSIGYGVVYDYIADRFGPYQGLHAELLKIVEEAIPPAVERRDVRVLDVGCGPGGLTCALGEAGFAVTGVDPYGALVEVAKEKRRARRLTNVTFRHADLGQGTAFRDAAFDQVVNVHSLYAQAAPDRLLAEVFRVLKPGGHAVFVNHTRRLGGWSTLRGVARARGLRAALGSLLWIVPNAIFEVLRRPTGPHYWDETVFADRLGRAGFAVLETRRTFLAGASLLVRARKPSEA